ncbi:MAG: hypothetical protein HGA39_06340 [Coriobacteriia bacterium]|nr:hypothetical protein [Coriobacteriia bacterium]
MADLSTGEVVRHRGGLRAAYLGGKTQRAFHEGRGVSVLGQTADGGANTLPHPVQRSRLAGTLTVPASIVIRLVSTVDHGPVAAERTRAIFEQLSLDIRTGQGEGPCAAGSSSLPRQTDRSGPKKANPGP